MTVSVPSWRSGVVDYALRLVGGSVLLFGAAPLFLCRLGWTATYGEGVLAGTGVAVVWYTVETFYLRRAMVRANEIAVLPLVVASVEFVEVHGPARNYAEKVVLRNLAYRAV